MARRFHDRREAGRQLAERLAAYRARPDVLVLALPRGGVPVAFEVALALHAPLDVFLVRKLGTPGQPELAMGAIATGGIRVVNADVVDAMGIPNDAIEATAREQQQELERRERAYRDDRAQSDVGERVVILVDDGVATGSTMRAAIAALRRRQPARIVVAVPAAAPQVCAMLQAEADELICLVVPEPFYAVGLWYEDFSPVGDDEVRELLAKLVRRKPADAIR